MMAGTDPAEIVTGSQDRRTIGRDHNRVWSKGVDKERGEVILKA